MRTAEDPQKFMIQYNNGDMRTYLSTDRCGADCIITSHPRRDSLLASLLDSVRATGNVACSVLMLPVRRGERFQRFDESPDEETESALLKFIGFDNPGVWCVVLRVADRRRHLL